MTIQGDAAVEAEMKNLLKFMDGIKNNAPEIQLEAIRIYIISTIETAKAGWL